MHFFLNSVTKSNYMFQFKLDFSAGIIEKINLTAQQLFIWYSPVQISERIYDTFKRN